MSIQQCAADVAAIVPKRTITMPDGTRLPLRVAFVAIAGQESRWETTAQGDAYGTCPTCDHPICNGYTSFGYYQFHLAAWAAALQRITGSGDPCTWAAWLKNGRNNVKLAWQAYQDYERNGQNGFRPWWPDVAGPYADYPRVTERHPPYQTFVPQARQAVAAVETSLSVPPSPVPAVPPTVATPSRVWLWTGLGLVVAGAAAVVIDELEGSQ